MRIISHCMTSYNFEANAVFVISLALKNSLKHIHEKWTHENTNYKMCTPVLWSPKSIDPFEVHWV